MPTVLPMDGYGKVRFKSSTTDEPLVGGKLYFYTTGTSTPKDTYSDAAGSSLNTNPVILDSRGEASVYLQLDAAYKMILTDEDDVPVAGLTLDPVRGLVDIGYLQTYALPDFANLTEETSPAVGDLVPLRDISAAAGVGADRKMTLQNIFKVVGGFTAETAINPFNDPIPFYDTSALAIRTAFIINMLLDGPDTLLNHSITASVATKALTIARKTKAGTDPSSTDKAIINFRSTTLTSGLYVQRLLSAAASIVIPSGATLGFTNSETGYIYVYEVDDGTNQRIGVSKRHRWSQGTLHSSSAIGTGSDDGDTLYTSSAMSNAAVRLVARITIQTGAVAGEWDNAHTVIEPWTPAMKKTGDIIQTVYAPSGEVATTTTTIPDDDTIPEITEGGEFMTRAITPTNALNRLIIDLQAILATGAGGRLTLALFQDATTNALVAARHQAATTAATYHIHARHEMAAGTASTTTFRARAGNSAAGTVTFNGEGGSRELGGVFNSYMSVIEVQA